MIVGVTGTRSGMNERQFQEVEHFLATCGGTVLHHGDCIGVDVEVAVMAKSLGYVVYSHPPVKTELRAYHESDIILEPKGYFARNRDIVDASQLLIVVPWQDEHSDSGGTWYTHDYAVKVRKPVRIFYPTKQELL